jgi:hypothetical protein
MRLDSRGTALPPCFLSGYVMGANEAKIGMLHVDKSLRNSSRKRVGNAAAFLQPEGR